MNSGADALVRGRPPGRPAGFWKGLILREKSGTRASRADQGVRPTITARIPCIEKACGIRLKAPRLLTILVAAMPLCEAANPGWGPQWGGLPAAPSEHGHSSTARRAAWNGGCRQDCRPQLMQNELALGGVLTPSGTPPLAYARGSVTLAKSMSVPSRDGNGAVSFPVIPRTCTRPGVKGREKAWGRCEPAPLEVRS